jgi:quaternary ammonium compound-resistance protein SugE
VNVPCTFVYDLQPEYIFNKALRTKKMAWIYLFIAGLLEVTWAVGMKYAEGFTKLGPSIFTIVSMTAGIIFLAMAMKTLPLGTAYAVWTGIGTIGTVIFGIIFFNEPKEVIRVVCILLILIGIVGLKITSKS